MTSLDTQRSPETSPRTGTFRISETMVLAAIPVLVYVYTLHYEVGYASAFGYPEELVDLDFTALARRFEVFFPPLMLLGLAVLNIPTTWFYAIIIWGAPIGVMIYAVFFEEGWYSWFLLAMGVLMILFALTSPLAAATKKKKAGLTGDLTDEQSDELYFGGTVLLAVLRHLGIQRRAWVTGLLLFILLMGGMEVVRALGRRHALLSRDVLLTGERHQLILLRQYGDYWVCAGFDQQTNTVLREFYVIPLSDTSRAWTSHHVERLRVSAPDTLNVPTPRPPVRPAGAPSAGTSG